MPGAVIVGGHIHGLAIARSLGRAGFSVHILDRYKSLAQYSRYCTAYAQCPDYCSPQFAPFLLNYAQKNFTNLQTLFLTDDSAIRSVAQYKKKLSQYYHIIYPDNIQFDRLFHKKKFFTTVQSIKLPIPKTWLTNDQFKRISDNDFPLLIKGDDSLDFWQRTGVKAIKIDAQKDFTAMLQKLAGLNLDDKIFAQECLPVDNNPVISFTAFSINGEIKCYWVGEKMVEHPHPFGIAIIARSVKLPKLFPIAKRLLQALDYTGVCELEFLRDNKTGEYKILEMNARTWLWLQCAVSSGIDFPLYMQHFLSEGQSEFPQSYTKDVFWINSWYIMLTAPIKLIKRELSLKQILQILASKKSFAIYNSKDIKPFLIYSLKLHYYINHI